MNIVRKTKIKRLYSRRLARVLEATAGKPPEPFRSQAEKEARFVIERQREKGWEMVTRLENGEGVFVRDDDVAALHIQLPTALYKKLDDIAEKRALTKRQIVVVALERYLSESY